MGRLNRVASIKDVASGHAIAVDLGKQAIAVFNAEGEFHAIGDICTHEVAYGLKRKRPTILLLRFDRGSGRYLPRVVTWPLRRCCQPIKCPPRFIAYIR